MPFNRGMVTSVTITSGRSRAAARWYHGNGHEQRSDTGRDGSVFRLAEARRDSIEVGRSGGSGALRECRHECSRLALDRLDPLTRLDGHHGLDLPTGPDLPMGLDPQSGHDPPGNVTDLS